MTYEIKIGKEVNTDDIDFIYSQIGWDGLRDKEQWLKVIDKSTFLVQILDNKKTIGFGRAVDDGDMCMIYDICVLPAYQKQGIGTLIMTEIKKYITSQNFIRIQLFTYDKNPTLAKFYEKFGFHTVNTGMCIVGSRFDKKE